MFNILPHIYSILSAFTLKCVWTKLRYSKWLSLYRNFIACVLFTRFLFGLKGKCNENSHHQRKKHFSFPINITLDVVVVFRQCAFNIEWINLYSPAVFTLHCSLFFFTFIKFNKILLLGDTWFQVITLSYVKVQ